MTTLKEPNMKVEMINFTELALETLLYTKNTRLQGSQSFLDVCSMSEDEKMNHLKYMKDTIQSSWEFVDYTFEISGVTRAFTHQLVRTRTASFAQESQRTIDASEHEVINTCDNHSRAYTLFASESMINYKNLLDMGVPVQDARGLLPTNISTSIIVKLNLRTIHDMGLLRLCTRAQGEYQRAFRLIKEAVVELHPWAEQFIKVHCAWYGSCAFPRYKECPVKWETSDESDLRRKKKFENKWKVVEHEANPVAKGGMTQ